MKKLICLILSFITISQTIQAAESIDGFWKTVNEQGETQCIIAVYDYEGICYGKIIATFNKEGQIKDSIYKPIERAPGVVGDPYYCGLDIIWDLEDSGQVFKGRIMDPERGKVYKAELWKDNDDLIVRGKLLMFGRSQKWYPVIAKNLPEDFKLPQLSSLTPSVPQPK